MGTRDGSGPASGNGSEEAIWLETALLAARALAICSRRAADDFRADWGEAESAESEVIPVLPDAAEAPEGFDPSLDVADESREVVETFLGVSFAAVLLIFGIEGFLNRPLMDGLLVGGRAATVLAPNFDTVTSGPRFSGLGDLDWGILLVVGDRRP